MAANPFAPLGDAPEVQDVPEAAATWQPEMPAPEEPPKVWRHPRLGLPVCGWTYRDAAGRPLCRVFRFNATDGGKEFLPLTYGTSKGQRRWHWKAPAAPRPLYGLAELAARPEAPVIICEGEKAADAAAALFPEHVAVSWQGGSGATDKVDWRPLEGRRVAIWPDHDAPGAEAAGKLRKALVEAGAASVAVVVIPADWPEKWDLADALPPAATAETLRLMLADAAAEMKAPDVPSLPRPFHMRDSGVWWQAEATEGGREPPPPVHVCGPLRVVAATNNGSGQAWGALLEWEDADGRQHQWAMPRAMLAGDGKEVRSHLLDGGLFLGSGRKAREKLAEYLTRANPPDRVRVVSRIGWHGAEGRRVFVLPDATMGRLVGERVMLQTERPDALPPLHQSGTLAEWQSELAALAVGNSRLGFSLAVAFAAPLAALIGAEGGGFHLRGPSSVGKSTALHVAGSVWGGGGLRGWCRSWRTTDNSLEAVAAAHCDLLLCLDEMGEAGAETVASAAYMLANGAGKGRAGRDGSARRVAEWRTLFLSTGEEGIADRMAEARGGAKRTRAGQEVRVLDIPAAAGPHGLFETLHDHPGAGALADALKAAVARCYGTAGRAWLQILADDPEGMARDAREVVAAFLAANVPKDAAGQVRRAAGRFALAAAAGELAAASDLLPWPPGEAEKAAAACFAAWRGARQGGDGAAEDAAAVAAVRAFIGAHAESRFQTLGTEGDAAAGLVVNRAGWRKRDGTGWQFLILPEAWRSEVVPGMDPQAAANALKRADFLIPQEHGRLQRAERVGLSKPVRVYVIRDTILAGEMLQ
ncbi:DUF927 domain-containing protein [Sediminicoccus sp. BL-A-41-H5]|uniref:DUF927 domain-containing protein n=1 Tax=Sediminicoccus sp. BL-A-41-H5 TaxID=3421106 RepID=UPI003D67E540